MLLQNSPCLHFWPNGNRFCIPRPVFWPNLFFLWNSFCSNRLGKQSLRCRWKCFYIEWFAKFLFHLFPYQNLPLGQSYSDRKLKTQELKIKHLKDVISNYSNTFFIDS